MFFNYDDQRIRYTGRWGEEKDQCGNKEGCITTTAVGAYFEFAFEGEYTVLRFDVISQSVGVPHLWICVDGGAKMESVVMPYIRVQTAQGGIHTVCVIVKCANELLQRWYTPIVSCVRLRGVEADSIIPLPADERKTIEFVGDSITEGVSLDEKYRTDGIEALDRLYRNDICASYSWLTAEKLNFRPIIMGYGAVGVTHGGNGGVPKAQAAYPYNFGNSPINYPEPDYVIINHGANDADATKDIYCRGYRKLIDTIRCVHPNSKIIAMAALCGAHTEALEKLIIAYNSESKADIIFIDTNGWIPKEPLHPQRGGHRVVAEKLAEALTNILQQ